MVSSHAQRMVPSTTASLPMGEKTVSLRATSGMGWVRFGAAVVWATLVSLPKFDD